MRPDTNLTPVVPEVRPLRSPNAGRGLPIQQPAVVLEVIHEAAVGVPASGRLLDAEVAIFVEVPPRPERPRLFRGHRKGVGGKSRAGQPWSLAGNRGVRAPGWSDRLGQGLLYLDGGLRQIRTALREGRAVSADLAGSGPTGNCMTSAGRRHGLFAYEMHRP